MKGLDWRKKADSLGLGILPVKIKKKAKWQVCGIQSKSKGENEEVLEAQKLCYLWIKWLKESGGSTINEPILNASANKIKRLTIYSEDNIEIIN